MERALGPATHMARSMETAEIPCPNENVGPEDTPCPFELVIVFEDTTTRNRSFDLCENLSERLKDSDLKTHRWHLNDFSNAALRERSAKVAAQARMIVLSLRAGSQIPDALRQWMNLWLPSKALRSSALVTLVAGAPQQDPVHEPIQEQLRRVADRAGMDFFVQEFDGQDADVERLVAGFDTEILERSTSDRPLDESSFDTDFQWGING